MKMAAQTRFWIRHACRDIPAPFSAKCAREPTLSHIRSMVGDLYVTWAVDLIAIAFRFGYARFRRIDSNLHGDHFTLHLTAAATAQDSACLDLLAAPTAKLNPLPVVSPGVLTPCPV